MAAWLFLHLNNLCNFVQFPAWLRRQIPPRTIKNNNLVIFDGF